jgi:hypothetical protein
VRVCCYVVYAEFGSSDAAERVVDNILGFAVEMSVQTDFNALALAKVHTILCRWCVFASFRGVLICC